MKKTRMRYCPWCGGGLEPRQVGERERLACGADGCGYVFWDNPTPIVAAIVEQDDHVVLIRNKGWPEKWLGLVSGFLERDAVLAALSETFAKKHPSAMGPNERTFVRGCEEVRLVAEPRPDTGDQAARRAAPRPGPEFGYLTAPIGGCITEVGNTVFKDLSASRQGFVPVFDPEECVHCGLCDLVCPDHCFVWRQEPGAGDEEIQVRLAGIDYNYCKGCMRCIDSCPSGALTKHEEPEGFADAHRVPMFSNPRKSRRR